MSNSTLPAKVSAAGARSERLLDVRPLLGKGADPFQLILKTVQQLAQHEALHLVVGFEPAPLYAVLKAHGRSAYTEKEGELVHVWFYSDPNAAAEAKAQASQKVALQPPVELDVSGLEPPTPMITILEKLGELGPGAQLLVRHHREPVLLYEKLALRGYGARATKRGEGDYLVHIAPTWALEPGGGEGP